MTASWPACPAANDAQLDELDKLLVDRRGDTIAPLLDDASVYVPAGDACLRW